MTETDWLNSTDPTPMLEFLRTSGRLSDRKARLFAVACCRGVWPVLTDANSRNAVDVAENLADGLVSEEKRHIVRMLAREAAFATHEGPRWMAGWAAEWTVAVEIRQEVFKVIDATAEVVTRNKERSGQCTLLRDLFGPLPFCPLPLPPSIRTWNDGCILKLARAAYEERELPSGHLDNHRLAVLAEALEEAGVTDPDLLGHLRGPGPHTRGCWAVDLLLDKE